MIHPRKFLWSMILLIGAITLVSCGGGGGSSAPAPTTGTTVTKFAILDGSQETPAAVTTSANGAGSLTVDTGTGDASGSLTILSAPATTIFAAHVHSGARGVGGPVIITLDPPASGGNVWTVPTSLTQEQKDAVKAGFIAGNLYFNAHTPGVNNGGGEIRGQIDQTSITMYARLDGAQETPAPVTTSAAGTGNLTLNADTGAVTGSMTITVPPAGAIFAAHVHSGARGVGGPVLITLDPPVSGGNVWTIPSSLTQTQKDGVVAGLTAGNLYFNAHTQGVNNGSGEIRGQIDLIAP